MNPVEDKIENDIEKISEEAITAAKDINTDAIFAELIAKVKGYNPQLDEKLLTKAYEIAKKYHDTQYRKSGEPFVSHPLEVAKILAGIELDQTSIIAAIIEVWSSSISARIFATSSGWLTKGSPDFRYCAT